MDTVCGCPGRTVAVVGSGPVAEAPNGSSTSISTSTGRGLGAVELSVTLITTCAVPSGLSEAGVTETLLIVPAAGGAAASAGASEGTTTAPMTKPQTTK